MTDNESLDRRTEGLGEILDQIQKKLSYPDSAYWTCTLSEEAQKKITAFIHWLCENNESPTIKLRKRSVMLFGKEGSQFNAKNLYKEVFDDIKKETNEETGKSTISCPLIFDITFNESLTNIKLYINKKTTELKNSDDKTPVHSHQYGQIELGKTPVLYMLYIDPKDFILKGVD